MEEKFNDYKMVYTDTVLDIVMQIDNNIVTFSFFRFDKLADKRIYSKRSRAWAYNNFKKIVYQICKENQWYCDKQCFLGGNTYNDLI